MRLGTKLESNLNIPIHHPSKNTLFFHHLAHSSQNAFTPLLFQGEAHEKDVLLSQQHKRPSIDVMLSERDLIEMQQVPLNDVEAALDNIGDIRRRDRNGGTLLHALVLRPYVIQKLLQRGLDPNITDFTGNTALHNACRLQVIPSVRMLLQAGANPNLRNHEKDSPLHLNMIHSRQMIPIATELLNAGAKVNRLNADRNTPLIEAVHMGDEALVELLLQHHARINQHGNMGTTPLHEAALLGRGEMVDLLLKYGASLETLNHLEQTPLHLAAGHGEIKTLQSLLNAGASPHVQDKLGRTPLHDACLSSHPESVEILINHHADPSITDRRGTTPLHDAAESGDYKTLYPVLKAARAKGLPLYDLKDQNGNTPFHHYLISSGDTRGGKLFLRMGADPRITNADGLNSLHLALLHHHSDLIDSLLIKGSTLSPPLRMDELAKKIRIVSKMDMSPSHTQVPLMLRAMPSLLLELPLVVSNEFAERFELFFDKPEDVHGYHPLESEMMLLLNHPDLQDRDPQKTSSLTQALTSISYFIGDYIPLSDPVLKSWKDIGLLTHSFRFWRFDAMGGESSLFNAFGFKPIPDPRPGEIFGKGFVYQDPDSKMVFEFRRGYLLASHPQHGTLVIRNSSPVFGRKLLNHPAYLLPISFDKDSLKTFDPSKIDEKLYVLNKELYRNPDTSDHLSALTEGLMYLKDEYKRFKLDTEAFEGYGTNKHFTGHLVPGLPALMKQIKSFQILKPNAPLPDLGFVDSRFPIYQTYAYQDNQNQRQQRYPLNAQNLQELEDFTQGHWTSQKYPDSNWIRFLHQAGVENRAELVMLEADTTES